MRKLTKKELQKIRMMWKYQPHLMKAIIENKKRKLAK